VIALLGAAATRTKDRRVVGRETQLAVEKKTPAPIFL
jgi:hypothetical protein